MGGTFDPIHTGHLVVAEEARTRFGLDEVIFMPAAVPPHKHREDISPAEDRYAMVLLATASNPCFRSPVSNWIAPGPRTPLIRFANRGRASGLRQSCSSLPAWTRCWRS